MIRKTDETFISINDWERLSIATGDTVFDHLLKTLFYYMGRDVKIEAKFDIRHHLWEDMGIVIGEFLKKSTKGTTIKRFGTSILPMDDALILVSLDISRAFFSINLNIELAENGFEVGNFKEFISALSRTLPATIHVKQINGENAHHIIEASFKALGIALKQALQSSDRFESTNMVHYAESGLEVDNVERSE
ncbi:MAG TPA: imidazoleglycerol-phosphate dehydratase HisB [Fervidobacterium sp.]|nr:imidazoleglycerol-phosphate dehydratase HisB [Fervidobacterium sp.]HPT54571.1 imidazoleglycerol-phosphate dehydratase HisB [Fervidobacterium sp.]HPZ18043.1 imidazoleglycerol-phosphate dehydratase HisB [Fervidobacterium sp.]HQE48644.1 imidazoleglycerol-phosphate dehydratase HisB [Fervidobacterium sp.]HUM43026.1 imidazoleglycerol-phosphate dehydratase HisB [Fervidobacterium sp.]